MMEVNSQNLVVYYIGILCDIHMHWSSFSITNVWFVKYLLRAVSTRASHICKIIPGQITLATSRLFRHSGMCIQMFVIPGEGTSIKDWHTRARTKYFLGGYLS